MSLPELKRHLAAAAFLAVFLTPFLTAVGYLMSGSSEGLTSVTAVVRAAFASAGFGFALSLLRTRYQPQNSAQSSAIYASLTVILWLAVGYTPSFASTPARLLAYVAGCVIIGPLVTWVIGRATRER